MNEIFVSAQFEFSLKPARTKVRSDCRLNDRSQNRCLILFSAFKKRSRSVTSIIKVSAGGREKAILRNKSVKKLSRDAIREMVVAKEGTWSENEELLFYPTCLFWFRRFHHLYSSGNVSFSYFWWKVAF